jgi:hypothetical protein
MAVHGLLVQVTEHDGVLGYLGRPGDRDGRGGGLERDGIAVKDPESGGSDRAAGCPAGMTATETNGSRISDRTWLSWPTCSAGLPYLVCRLVPPIPSCGDP